MITRPDLQRKYMNTDKARLKEPEWTTLISEVGSGTNVQVKQVHVLQYQLYSKTRAEPECRIRH